MILSMPLTGPFLKTCADLRAALLREADKLVQNGVYSGEGGYLLSTPGHIYQCIINFGYPILVSKHN